MGIRWPGPATISTDSATVPACSHTIYSQELSDNSDIQTHHSVIWPSKHSFRDIKLKFCNLVSHFYRKQWLEKVKRSSIFYLLINFKDLNKNRNFKTYPPPPIKTLAFYFSLTYVLKTTLNLPTLILVQ